MPYSAFRHSGGVRDITEIQKRSQAKISKIQKRKKEGKERSPFGDRVVEAFGTDDYSKIAERLQVESRSRLTVWMRAKGVEEGTSAGYPPLSILVKISEITKYDLVYLLTGKGEKSVVGADNWKHIEQISSIKNRSIKETVTYIIVEALKERVSQLASALPSLNNQEIEELHAFERMLEEWREVFIKRNKGNH